MKKKALISLMKESVKSEKKSELKGSRKSKSKLLYKESANGFPKSSNEVDLACEKYTIKEYTINDDLSIDVDGSVNLKSQNLEYLPLKFNYVKGNFSCYYNKLLSLEGSPQTVDGNFNCFDNKLLSLKDGPQTVKGIFNCSYNELTTLEDSPQTVGRSFDCSNNDLIQLKGGPKKVNGNFDCSRNKLKSLEGGPEIVKKEFDCSNNDIISLKGGPKNVGTNFDCFSNELVSLKGSPQTINGDFNCGYNKLKTLEGAPKTVKGLFYVKENDLRSLDGLPKVGGEVVSDLKENKLRKLKSTNTNIMKKSKLVSLIKESVKSEKKSGLRENRRRGRNNMSWRKKSKMLRESLSKRIDPISMRLFLESIGIDPDDHMFSIAIEDGDMEETMLLLLDTASNGDEDNPFDGIFTKSDFIEAGKYAGIDPSIIDTLLDREYMRNLELG